jgi:hypothetical protein
MVLDLHRSVAATAVVKDGIAEACVCGGGGTEDLHGRYRGKRGRPGNADAIAATGCSHAGHRHAVTIAAGHGLGGAVGNEIVGVGRGKVGSHIHMARFHAGIDDADDDTSPRRITLPATRGRDVDVGPGAGRVQVPLGVAVHGAEHGIIRRKAVLHIGSLVVLRKVGHAAILRERREPRRYGRAIERTEDRGLVVTAELVAERQLMLLGKSLKRLSRCQLNDDLVQCRAMEGNWWQCLRYVITLCMQPACERQDDKAKQITHGCIHRGKSKVKHHSNFARW